MILTGLMLWTLAAIQPAPAPAFQLDPETWKGWRYEKLEFPLSFAPELKYEGFEELWFAPGMFDPESPTYFTYAFKMVLTGERPDVREFLLTYYTGLCRAVGKEKNIELDLSQIAVACTGSFVGCGPTLTGYGVSCVVDMADPFVTGAPIRLYVDMNVTLYGSSFEGNQKFDIRATASPRKPDFRDPIRKTMNSLLAGMPENHLDARDRGQSPAKSESDEAGAAAKVMPTSTNDPK